MKNSTTLTWWLWRTFKNFLMSQSELRVGTEPPLKSKLWLANHIRWRMWLHCCYFCCYCSSPKTWVCVLSCSNERPGKATLLVYMCICPLQQDIIWNKLYVMYIPVFMYLLILNCPLIPTPYSSLPLPLLLIHCLFSVYVEGTQRACSTGKTMKGVCCGL